MKKGLAASLLGSALLSAFLCLSAVSETLLEQPEQVRLGLSSSNVVAVMGPPAKRHAFDSISMETLYYGKSLVRLHEGKVVGWSDQGDLKVFAGDPQPSAPMVQVGFTASQVAAAMGTPRDIEFDYSSKVQTWRYGSSGIKLQNGRVVDWTDFGNLRVTRLGTPEPKPVAQQTGQVAPPQPIPAPRVTQPIQPQQPVYTPPVAENGSRYGEPNKNGVAKTVHVGGYYRKDGTYVRGHYRSSPGSNSGRKK